MGSTLRGTLYAIGPGSAPRAGGLVESAALAQGSVVAIRFGDGPPVASTRLVRTPSWELEERTGRVMYRSFAAEAHRPFLAGADGWHPANAGLFARGARLHALGPTGPCIAVDPLTLESLGVLAVDDVADPFVSPPMRLAARAASYAFTCDRRRLALRSFPDMRPAALLAELPARPWHPWRVCAVTERHAILLEPPLVLEGGWPGPAKVPLASSLRWTPSLGTRVVVIPIDSPRTPYELHLDAPMVFDVLSAEERGAGSLELLVTAHADPWPSLAWWAESPIDGRVPSWQATLHRIAIDLRGSRAVVEPLGETPLRGATYAPEQRQPLAFAWSPTAPTGGAPDALVRIEVSTGLPHPLPMGAARLRGALPIGRPGQGRAIVVFADGEAEGRGAALVLDEEPAEGALLAAVDLPFRVPRRTHGVFLPDET